MYYPETTKNATHVYVEREKNQAGTFGRRFEGPFPITRRIGARQLEIQVGFTAKGERRLEIQVIPPTVGNNRKNASTRYGSV